MTEQSKTEKNKFSTDWLLRGVLTKIGDTFDRLTGRGYKPSSSLATSELIEKLKKMLDLELKDGKFVPHNLKIKMQWDKFSTDSDGALRKLENEIKVAIIDHINDNRYHTYAPLKLQIKPDYFTDGVKLLASFDKFDEEEREVAVNVTVPQIKVGDYAPAPPPEAQPADPGEKYIAHFTVGPKTKSVELVFAGHQRISVGRSGENDLSIEDQSVSKIHASLILNPEKKMAVADTGSTNGTFINDKRIAYGRAVEINEGERVKFGNIEVRFEYVPKPIEEIEPEPAAESFVPTATAEISQSSINTVAFNSEQDLRLEEKPVSPPPTALPMIEKTMVEVPKVDTPKVEVIKKIEPPSDVPKPRTDDEAENFGTQDRIVFDFTDKS